MHGATNQAATIIHESHGQVLIAVLQRGHQLHARAASPIDYYRLFGPEVLNEVKQSDFCDEAAAANEQQRDHPKNRKHRVIVIRRRHYEIGGKG